MITQSYTLESRTKTNSTNQNLPISMSDRIKNNENPTMCILHSTLRDATTTYTERYEQFNTTNTKVKEHPSTGIKEKIA